jgi:iron complex outermembrane receptor protein
LFAILLAVSAAQLSAQNDAPIAPASAQDLNRLSIEELMQQEVISVSRIPQQLARVPSAMVVVGGDDIRAAGATRLAETLRLAPNLQVAQVDARQWAITARGSNSTTANKLLVMIDGRTVYTPLFAGVFWDSQDTYVPDIDRIEVVSGPAGTSWGTNAVNGVINVVTKRAQDTQGVHLFGGAGTETLWTGGVRYGGRVGQNGYYRVYAKGAEYDDALSSTGASGNDAWSFRQGGFRMDLEPQELDSITVQGDMYRGRGLPATGRPFRTSGGNTQLTWRHSTPAAGELIAKVYYDESKRIIPNTFDERLRTYDFDVQYRFDPTESHTIVSGLNARYARDNGKTQPALAFFPERLNFLQYSGFIQDEWRMLNERLRLISGVKLEHNEFAGTAWQPSIRAGYTMNARSTVWAAFSHAVRAPSRIDRDFYVPAQPPYFLAGGPNFIPEKLWAYELGYRTQLGENVALSATVFYHEYFSLRTIEPGVPSQIANGANADLRGAELNLEMHPTARLRTYLGYLTQHRDIRLKPWSRDLNRGLAEASDPDEMVKLGFQWEASRRFSLGGQWRYVDRLPTISNGVIGHVPRYFELDMHADYRLSDAWRVSLIGRNLLHSHHPEFGSLPNRREVQREVMLKFTFQR